MTKMSLDKILGPHKNMPGSTNTYLIPKDS